MKIKKTIFSIATALASLTSAAYAQQTATATATATIVTPITITKTVDLNFGNVAVQSSQGGTVVMTPGGVRSRTLGAMLPTAAGTVTAASFDVTGIATYTYAITLPTTVTLNGATSTMTATDFTSTPTGNSVALTGGTSTITVGATLNVAANQLPGEYISTTGFDVTVVYN